MKVLFKEIQRQNNLQSETEYICVMGSLRSQMSPGATKHNKVLFLNVTW